MHDLCKSRHEPIGVKGFLSCLDVFLYFGPSRENQRGKTNARCSLFPIISRYFLLCCTCWTLISRYFLICSKCWTMKYYTHVHIYFPNSPRSKHTHIYIYIYRLQQYKEMPRILNAIIYPSLTPGYPWEERTPGWTPGSFPQGVGERTPVRSDTSDLTGVLSPPPRGRSPEFTRGFFPPTDSLV